MWHSAPMDENAAPSVKKPKEPTVGCRVDPGLFAELDALRGLYAEGFTPDGRTSRSAVLRAILSQGRALLDHGNILAVRAIARREGIEVTEAWRRVITAGIGVFALDGAPEKSHREATPRSGNAPPPAPVPESPGGGEAPPRGTRRRGA